MGPAHLRLRNSQNNILKGVTQDEELTNRKILNFAER